ncbi:MAG TPA: DUF488 domain-containing protein [Kofleriaceae bacterium]|nr:DUF488 domain-containing protein [Kofleriaceae bacterium]
MTELYSIGYEGRTLDELLAILGGSSIDRVIDIRELPLSRRRGFSKTPLSVALAAADIEYLHLRIAGNPFRREKDLIPRDELLAKYRVHLSGARGVVGAVADAVRGHRAALLCYEHDPAICHRSILAPRVARKLGLRVKNL